MAQGRVLIIAGSDSGGGAGIQADIKAVTMTGGYAMTAVTAITVQNTLGVFDVHPIPLKTIKDQIICVTDDIGADCFKTGMLGTIEVVETIGETLALYPKIARVIDPVMIAKGGHPLLQEKAIEAVRSIMIPNATLLTPNAPEAEKFAQVAVETLDGQRRAAEKLLRMGARAVLVKGGHIEGATFTDLLATEYGETYFEATRIKSTSTHGTGCTLASAISSYSAQGLELVEAINKAREYVFKAIETAKGYGKGHGPLNHNWNLGN
jgi:hydroxymethylpyrimidine/phosphomethylpyrimidine kinase